MHEGIDLSAYQHANGGSIDYAAVKASGRSFAIVKVSDGLNTTVNPYSSQDISGFQGVGMQVAAYHFFQPNISGVDQATACLTVAQGLPVMLDAETGDPSLEVEQLRAFVATIQAANRKLLDYTNQSWFEVIGLLGDSILMADPSVTSPPPGFDAWQYAWQGIVPGITGYVDLDRWLDDISYQTFFGIHSVPSFMEVLMPVSDPNFAVRFLYRFCLHREVDPVGEAHYVGVLNQGGSLDSVMASLQDSPEGQAVIAAERKSLGLV